MSSFAIAMAVFISVGHLLILSEKMMHHKYFDVVLLSFLLVCESVLTALWMSGTSNPELINELMVHFFRATGFVIVSYGTAKMSSAWIKPVFLLSGFAVLMLSYNISVRNTALMFAILLGCIVFKLYMIRCLPEYTPVSEKKALTEKNPQLVEWILVGVIICILLLFGLGYVSQYAVYRYYVLLLVILFAGMLGAGNAGLYPASENHLWWLGYILSFSSVLCIMPFYNAVIVVLQCTVTAVLLWMYRKERMKVDG